MPIIDLHCDTASKIYYEKKDLASNDFHIDLEKMKKSHYLAQWFAFFIETSVLQGSLMLELTQMLNYFKAQVIKNATEIAIVTDSEGYLKCKQKGIIGAFLALEEGQTLEGDIQNLMYLEQMGIRMMNLTWNFPNDLGYPHHSSKGLTSFGKEVVSRLNDHKILLDVSHLSHQGIIDLSKLYHKPFLASHCNAYDLWPHTRNLKNEAIKLIAESGGVIGINFYNAFLGNDTTSRIDSIMNHIDYVYRYGGEECVALGSDFDGIDCKLEVCNAGEMDKLITKLLKVYKPKTVEKFCFQNSENFILQNL